jgi:hypothetical protein
MNNIQRIFLLFSALLMFFSTKVISQEEQSAFAPSGKVYGKVFSNFHYQLAEENESAFAVERAYIGYEHLLSENFTINLKLDIGSPNQESSYDIIKRYAYFKNAALIYSKDKLTLSFGLIDLYQFKIQEKFWGHRYIYKSFMDEHKFGASADLGASISYQVYDKVSADLTVINGEGYNQLQADNAYKTGFGITYLPVKGLTARFYVDYTEQTEIQTTWTGFVGYKLKDIGKIGAEYNFQHNNKYYKDYDLYGFSSYASYNIFEKWELFARYDRLWSNTIDGEENQWNIFKDGSALIGGIQFEPIKNIKIAANYQDWYPYAKNLENEAYFYLNLEYKF